MEACNGGRGPAGGDKHHQDNLWERPFMDWLISPSPSSHHITLKTTKLGNLTCTNPKDSNSRCVHKKNTFCAWKALGYSTSLQMNDNCCQTHFLSHSRWLNMASSSSVTVSWPEVPPLMLFSQHLSVCLPLCYHFSSTPISFHFLCRSPIPFLLPPPLLSRRLNQPVDKLGDKHTGCKLAWWLLLGRKAAWQPRLFTRLHASNLNSVPVSVPFESSINM